MIRILHTSDWHLGKRLERFSRHEEQKEVLEEILQVAEGENADIIIISGDLFDTYNPPAESLELFYHSLKKLSKEGQRPIIAIAGNHDMPERIEAPDPLARECGIVFAGFPETRVNPFAIDDKFKITQSEPGFIEVCLTGKPPLRILLTPYANELRLRKGLNPDDPENDLQQTLQLHWQNLADKNCNNAGVNLLVAHLLFMAEGEAVPEEPDDERPINHIGGAQALNTSTIPKEIQYAVLGHLHRYQAISGAESPVVYSGSPLSYSFSEARQQKVVVIVDLEPGKKANVRPVHLQKGRKLERKRFENFDEALNWLGDNPNALVELTLISDTFLSGEDRRLLHETHDGIVTIIPEIREGSGSKEDTPKEISRSESMQELFSEYFRSRNGQDPDQAILDLFLEVNAEEEES